MGFTTTVLTTVYYLKIKFLFFRFHLKGPNAGKSEIFIDGLSGMPDNIKKHGKGSFYIPLILTRIPILDNIGEYPTIRMIITKLLGLIDLTFRKIDSIYPNLNCKKAVHWVNIKQTLYLYITTFIIIYILLYYICYLISMKLIF